MNIKNLILFLMIIFNINLLASASLSKYFLNKTNITIPKKDFKENIKENLSRNNLAYIEDSYRNRYILNKLQEIDFTQLNIFVSEPSYLNEYPSSILALNMNEDTYYFDLIFYYDHQNKRWLIFDLKERR